ncbi:hypothetical protein B0H14DRAFT_3458334 [Mycena olivaceomarginata]|nr:hypothetical protein B0H14DRAFT_3458334 [Mycena olivaceomarginata]
MCLLLSCPRRSLPGLAPPILLGSTLCQAYPRTLTPSSVCPPCAARPCCADPMCTAPPPACAAPTPGLESPLRDAPQTPCILTLPAAVVRRPSASCPAPTVHCVPVRAATGPTYGLGQFFGIYPGHRTCVRRRSCCADLVCAGPPPHGAPACHPPLLRRPRAL